MSNTSYKTKECFSYLNKGFCPYGRRCNFIHPRPTERPLLLQQVINQIPEMVLLMHGPTSRLIPRLTHNQPQ